mmetsp:Transcript_25369/g.45941  ORF Transcript_25369/g.45941 Transcript_25369/m.45941 type:complete len:237 (+) Transcript_25369:282-992(+)
MLETYVRYHGTDILWHTKTTNISSRSGGNAPKRETTTERNVPAGMVRKCVQYHPSIDESNHPFVRLGLSSHNSRRRPIVVSFSFSFCTGRAGAAPLLMIMGFCTGTLTYRCFLLLTKSARITHAIKPTNWISCLIKVQCQSSSQQSYFPSLCIPSTFVPSTFMPSSLLLPWTTVVDEEEDDSVTLTSVSFSWSSWINSASWSSWINAASNTGTSPLFDKYTLSEPSSSTCFALLLL